jgi:16S rRNA (guanine966-N2)-methyltransferase
VLDLFAGTGALGIEALSRGAAAVTFVDDDRTAVASINANLESTGLPGATVVLSDAVRYVERSRGEHFDLAFADPPYSFDRWEELLAALPATVAVLESDHAVDAAGGWEVVKVRRYGGTVVTLVRRTTGALR